MWEKEERKLNESKQLPLCVWSTVLFHIRSIKSLLVVISGKKKSPEQKARITECNVGIVCVKLSWDNQPCVLPSPAPPPPNKALSQWDYLAHCHSPPCHNHSQGQCCPEYCSWLLNVPCIPTLSLWEPSPTRWVTQYNSLIMANISLLSPQNVSIMGKRMMCAPNQATQSFLDQCIEVAIT